MEISPLLLSALLLFSFVLGGAVGIVNDVNRITRVFFGVRYSDRSFKVINKLKRNLKETKTSTVLKRRSLDVLIFIQDLLLMILSGIGIVILCYYFNDGRFRFFTVLAFLSGFALYYFTVGKLIMLISEPITLIIRYLLELTIKIIAYPIKLTLSCLRSFYKKLYGVIKKRVAKRLNLRYNKRKTEEFKTLSELGFIGALSANNEKGNKYEGKV